MIDRRELKADKDNSSRQPVPGRVLYAMFVEYWA